MSTSTSNGNGISDRKLAANRANAQKSTGPRTEQGKRTSSLNALTHGLRARLSTDTLVCEHEREDFQTLSEALHEELNPQTPLQHLLAERLALLAWKLRRTAAAEAALLDKTVALRRDYEQKENDRAARRNPHAPLPNTLTTAAHVQAEQAAHNPRQNAWLTLHRYDQATQREFHKTLKQYQTLQRQHEDDELDEDTLLDICDAPNEPTEPTPGSHPQDSALDAQHFTGPNEPTPDHNPLGTRDLALLGGRSPTLTTPPAPPPSEPPPAPPEASPQTSHPPRAGFSP
jgi:hypothetical protein